MDNQLIVVKQLPVIEDQLLSVKESIQARVAEALSLVCTEETYKTIKKVRADLNKEYTELESRRKEVKAAVLKPYEGFEKVYKDCAGDIYVDADRKLKAKISEVEEGLRQQKVDAVTEYFAEYQAALGIDNSFVGFADAGIKVGLSDSLTSLKKKAKDFLDRIAADLEAIRSHDDRDEIITEYKRDFNLANAMNIVSARHKAIEEAKRQREAEEVARQERAQQQAALASILEKDESGPVASPVAPVSAPVAEKVETPIPVPEAVNGASDEPTYTTTFTVTATIEKLRELKKFLTEGGYIYE